jgi:hypothetical protein
MLLKSALPRKSLTAVSLKDWSSRIPGKSPRFRARALL